jgi:Fic family protein
MDNNKYSHEITAFHKRIAPEPGKLAGYSALITTFNLAAPVPDRVALISTKHKRYSTDNWDVYTPRHAPKNSLTGHLTFALKYEGIDLGVLKCLFSVVSAAEIISIIEAEPTSQYCRRIWFLYEWLMDKTLAIPDLKTGNYFDAIDDRIQYPGPPENSPRHRIRNNLPGVKDFCPLIRKTDQLEAHIAAKLDEKIEKSLNMVSRDSLMRAAAFLLLKDSKASHTIEGESPPQNRIQRWGRAIGQAGNKELSKEELLRLQKIVIEDARFIKPGWRVQGGFVGEHDRIHGTPIPDHISAKWQDLEVLINGFIKTNNRLQNSDFDPVLAATIIAFGFVLIHPFVDGNGRIHRYLIHHVLAKKGFTNKNLIFPVSAAILKRIAEYREVLESYSLARIELIDWRPTPDNNVEVLNDTIDFYRYFDATKMAEFLYSCVQQTIDEIIPEEVDYLRKYDEFKLWIEQSWEMPDKMIALLSRFLEQGEGKLSKRAREKDFQILTDDEIKQIEFVYSEIFYKK